MTSASHNRENMKENAFKRLPEREYMKENNWKRYNDLSES